MAAANNRYQQMQTCMTYALVADAAIFVLYMIFAGLGIVWLKVITAVLTLALSGACLAFLYISRELLKPRSLWMSTAAAAIAICLLFSLILNFPSPNKYKQDAADDSGTASTSAICPVYPI